MSRKQKPRAKQPNRPLARGTTLAEVVALREAGRAAAAERAVRGLLERQPDDAGAWEQLGHVLSARGEPGEAEAAMRRAVDRAADPFEPLFHLANLMFQRTAPRDAAAVLERALLLRPDNVATLSNLGAFHREFRNLERAATLLRRALELAPDHALAHMNLGCALSVQGHFDEALASLERAVALSPLDTLMHDNLLLMMHYSASVSPEAIAAAHARYGQIAMQIALPRPTPRPIDLERTRRLRVGLVSPDLRRHSVAFFLEPLLVHRDRAALEVFAYSNGPVEDEVTVRLKSVCEAWRDISSLADETALDLIRDDRLDLLIDLSGHTGRNRLALFAARAAPVQLTYLGYPNTTGLPTIDHRLTDTWADPPGLHDATQSERLLYMEHGFLCYSPPNPSPAVAAPPVLGGAALTFGSFNASQKISDKTLTLWARVLHALPESRLLLKDSTFGDPASLELFEKRLIAQGIPLERTRLPGHVPDLYSHLETYRLLDVALDTYPYHGTTTTCEALWMGVPVITLAGPGHVSRVGVSLLERVGLPEFIASTEDEYVEKAVALARDLPRLRELRTSARQRLSNSGLLDGPRMAASFERALRQAWNGYVDDALAKGVQPLNLTDSRGVPRASHSAEPPLPDPAARWQWLPGKIRIATPQSLEDFTSYVLEEQGDGSDEELRFVRKMLRGGETVIDVGAGHGIYALSMAREVGPAGRVYAIESESTVAARLRASASENRFAHLRVLDGGISTRSSVGLQLAGSGHAAALLETSRTSGEAAAARVGTLDTYTDDQAWTDVAFVRLGVAGKGLDALEGAEFLANRDEPLWMVRCEAGDGANEALRRQLEATGHSLFRLVPGLDVLVPLPTGSKADAHLRHVFAARPTRAVRLEEAGLLARTLAAESEVPAPPDWRTVVGEFPVLSRIGDVARFGEANADAGQLRHRMAIERYGLSLRRDLSTSVRWRCLRSAADLAAAAVESPDDLARVMTVARLAAALGQRAIALEWLEAAIQVVLAGKARMTEPFLPACPRFDGVDPGSRPGPWTLACLLEQREKLRAPSSYFSRQAPSTKATLETIAGLGFQSPEMASRLALVSRTR